MPRREIVRSFAGFQARCSLRFRDGGTITLVDRQRPPAGPAAPGSTRPRRPAANGPERPARATTNPASPKRATTTSPGTPKRSTRKPAHQRP